jgi:hypothetical protein
MMRLTRWSYRCGGCHHDYGLPGIDVSFFYGWFLGVSVNLEAVVLDAAGYEGFDEIQAIIDGLADELPNEDPGLRTAKILGQVCDPDQYGDRYTFNATPGCPACASTKVEAFRETEETWPQPARYATTAAWDVMDHHSRVTRVGAALGVDPPPPQP